MFAAMVARAMNKTKSVTHMSRRRIGMVRNLICDFEQCVKLVKGAIQAWFFFGNLKKNAF